MIGNLVIQIFIIIAHVFIVGMTWQVIVLYLLPVFLVVYYLIGQIEYKVIREPMKRLFLIVLIVIQMVSVLAVLIFPEIVLEEPVGDYEVGTTLFNLEDLNRTNPYSDGNREVRLQVWYPIKNTTVQPVKWFVDGDKTLEEMAKAYALPSFVLGHLNRTYTNSKLNLEVHSGKDTYPVIIMNHGWSSSRLLHVSLMEALASHGFIVIGMDHPNIAAITRLENGDLAKHMPEILPEDDMVKADEMLHVMKDDLEFLFSKLEYLNETHKILKEKMNLYSIGLIGHSSGGGAQSLFLQENDVQAAVALDAYIKPIEVKEVKTPVLYLASSEWLSWNQYDNIGLLTDEFYELELSTHEDFTEIYRISPVLTWIKKTSGESAKLQEEIILEFFTHSLKYDLEKYQPKTDDQLKVHTVK
jgi:dienelactone hydrolase